MPFLFVMSVVSARIRRRIFTRALYKHPRIKTALPAATSFEVAYLLNLFMLEELWQLLNLVI